MGICVTHANAQSRRAANVPGRTCPARAGLVCYNSSSLNVTLAAILPATSLIGALISLVQVELLMDTTQLAQMVTWLDEQHRRDRAEIAKLQQRIESQTNEIQEQARRLKDLEAQVTATQGQLGRFAQIEQSLQNMRNELVLMVNGQNEEVSKVQREVERARMGDRETFSAP